ncbi:MAG: DUF4402 domain-containing protein [Alphaproteobacteria bacterium]|nr:DUF4402 domain-containing protein [Alphaproteobacteria bacterium]MBN2780169.1 DUF4402 domain-containing protein [Alphaproteobacteria bacterium]
MRFISHLFFTGITMLLSNQSSAVFGIGHARAELASPLIIIDQIECNFGFIAIDPDMGFQTISMTADGTITCPETYVCGGNPNRGQFQTSGAPNALVNINITGATATLGNGAGGFVTFDPTFEGETDILSNIVLDQSGTATIPFGGKIDFTGNESPGTYTSSNGSSFLVTVNY